MELLIYAVISLFFPVPVNSAKCRNSRNGLPARELRGIIRRSQPALLQFSLLFTLLAGKGAQEHSAIGAQHSAFSPRQSALSIQRSAMI